MTDFYKDLTDDAPIAKTITRGKKTLTAYFRRLTAGERLQLVSGQKMTYVDGKRGDFEVDMGEVARNRHLLVKFANVTAEGAQVFGDVREVQALPDWLAAELAKYADEVNRDDAEEAGNA